MSAAGHRPARLLVTGGAGFIGANFVHYWLREHPDARVVVLDALTYAGNRESLAPLSDHPGYRFVHGDIRDQALVEQLLREEAIDTLVHLAAESHVDRSILGPAAFVETNIVGTHRLLEAARAVWLAPRSPVARHRFHHVSTDEVYGSLPPDAAPADEGRAYAPSSPYAASKAAADHLVRAWHRTYGLGITISNCSNNHGPYQFPEKLIPLVIVNALEGRPLPVYGSGENTRDWLHVADHLRGLERILHSGADGRTYNLGAGNERPNLETVALVCRLLDEAFARDPELAGRFPECPPARRGTCAELITTVADRPGHDRRHAIDAARARRELAWSPSGDFEAGLRDTVRWYLSNEPWWRAVMSGEYRAWIERQYGAG